MYNYVLMLWIMTVIVRTSVCNNLPTLTECISNQSASNILSCVGSQAIYTLNTLEQKDKFTLIDGLTMMKDQRAGFRNIDLLDIDPSDFRGILKNAEYTFGQRILRFDASRIYPGLIMWVRPNGNDGTFLEFTIDPDVSYTESRYSQDKFSTGRTIVQKILLPFLLGLKINLSAMIPLIFTLIIFICKKALFLAKVAMVLSTVLGVGNFFSLGALLTGNEEHHEGNHHNHHFYGPGYGGLNSHVSGVSHGYDQNRHTENTHFEDESHQGYQDNFYSFEKKINSEPQKLLGATQHSRLSAAIAKNSDSTRLIFTNL